MDIAFGICVTLAALLLLQALRYPDAEMTVYGFMMWFVFLVAWDEAVKDDVRLGLGKSKREAINFNVDMDEIIYMAAAAGNVKGKRWVRRAKIYGEITGWAFGLVCIFIVVFLLSYLGEPWMHKLTSTTRGPRSAAGLLLVLLPISCLKLKEKWRRRKLLKQVVAQTEAEKGKNQSC
ncbi:MAG: hypothetical protein IJM64_01635 [Ottowia sp.]|nr:hypothetical protein [Ottowia sp.]